MSPILKRLKEIQCQKMGSVERAENSFRMKQSYLEFSYCPGKINKNHGGIMIVSVNTPIHKIIFGWLRYYLF